MGKAIMKDTQAFKRPIILEEGTYSEADLQALQSGQKLWSIKDIYQDQLAEYFEITHPDKRLSPEFENLVAEFIAAEGSRGGSWVYLPWSGELVHMVPEERLFALRTNRNRNLITHEDQTRLKDFSVGVVGLSVGAGIAYCLAHSGISSKMHLAEMDVLETANMNRLRAGVHQIGEPKIELAARAIYELNPYANLELFPDGLHNDNLDKFFDQAGGIKLVFDEIDDFKMKIKIRMAARDRGIPVIMLTSLGDNILVDVERYDLDKSTQLFNGLLGDLPEEILSSEISEREKVKYAMQIVGVEHIPTAALASLLEINRNLVGRPQLASTITMDGGLSAFLVRQLALKADLPSGRSYLSVGTALGLDIADDQKLRQDVVSKLNNLIS